MGLLSDQICATAQCDQQRILKLADGEGLYLWVYSDGRKYWRFRYRRAGKETSLSMGGFPHVSISDARNERDQIRTQIKNGFNPSELRRDARRYAAKSSNHRNQFLLLMSDDGDLTIETTSRVVTLTKSQTKALRVFLQATECHQN